MLPASRLPAVRICLLIVSVVLLSASAAPAAGAYPSRAAASSRSHKVSSRAWKRRGRRRKSSSERRTECVKVARAGKHRKAGKSCAVTTKPAVAGKPSGSGPSSVPAVASPGIQIPVIGGALPTEALEVPGSEPGPSTGSPGGSDKSPVVPTPPVETKTPTPPVESKTPVEQSPPIEEPNPPVEEPKQPVEGTKPPVEESTPPVEETKPPVEETEETKPVEEPKQPVEEEKAREEKAREEKAKEEKLEEEKAREEKPKEEKVKEESAPFSFFSPTSFWNEELPADAPLDPSSAAIVGALNEEMAKAVEAKKGPANINTTSWSVPIYTVPADQPTVKVTLENASRTPVLQSAWDAVPLPGNAQPAAGTDEHLVVWQPSTDRLWEFWRLEKTEAGWQASWGGAIQNVSSDSGAYGPEAWPGATRWWGASASSLSIAGGLITLEDLERGEINHALAMAVPNTRAGIYASPAERTDGVSTEPQSLPEGAHLRLEPNLDLASLHLPRLTLMMAEAAQRYGIFIRDTASNVAFYAQDPIPTGTNPYTGPHGYFEGKTAQKLMASFPWSHLQLLKMELHSES